MPNNPSSQQHSFTQTIWRNSLPNHERRRAHSCESPLHAGRQCIGSFELRALHQWRYFDLPPSAVGTQCLNSPWHVYIPLSLSLSPDIFGYRLELYPTSKMSRGALFLFIYSFFSLFIIHLFLLQPLADGQAELMSWNWLGLRRSICRSPSRSGLDVLLALEWRNHYGKLTWTLVLFWVVLEETLQLLST